MASIRPPHQPWTCCARLLSLILVLLCGAAALHATPPPHPPFEETITRLPGEGWRLSWNSEPGTWYRIERSATLDAGSWKEVATVQAESNRTEWLDPNLTAPSPRFWRIVTIPVDGGLTVSQVMAYADPDTLPPTAVFALLAFSDATVVEVRFFHGNGQLRGVASRIEGPLWEWRETYDPDHPEAVSLFGWAIDSLDRTAQTPLAGFLLADPERFIPLDEAGNARPGHFVPIAADGTLGRFEFRPDGRAPASRQTGLAVIFEPGARLVFRDGAYQIAFTGEATLRRGWFDPSPLPLGGILAGPADSHSGSPEFLLPIDGVTPAVLVELLSQEPGSPITLWTHGQVPLEWFEGPLGENGVDGLGTGPVWSAIGFAPLPGQPRKASLLIDPATGEPIYQIEYHGDYIFPGGLVFRIPRQAPWRFRIFNDWRIELSGEVFISLPNGGQLSGSVSWRNGALAVALTAHRLQFEGLSSLREFLPTDPAALVPATAADLPLDSAAAAFEAYRLAYRNFSAGAVKIDSVDRERDLTPIPLPIETAASTLEAWAWRLLAIGGEGPGAAVTPQAAAALLALTGQAQAAARSGYELPEVLAWQRSLRRLRSSLHVAAEAGRAGNSAALEAELTDAETRITAALEQRLETAGPLEILGQLEDVLRIWLDLMAVVEESGEELPAASRTALETFLTLAGGLFFDRLGIEPGEFDPTLNDTILGLDRFSTAAALRNTLDFFALATLLGEEQVIEGWRMDETLGQLVTRFADVHEIDLRDALQRRSFDLALIVARQRLELMAKMQLLGVNESFPEFFNDPVLHARWDEIAEEWLNNPSRPVRRDSLLEALRYLTKILAYVPDNAGVYSESVYGDLQTILETFLLTGRFNDALTPRDWLEWIQAAVLADRLGRRFFTATLTTLGTGEEPRSPLQILVDGLVARSGGLPGATHDPQFAYLDLAAGALLAEIQSLRLEVGSLDGPAQAARREIRLAYVEALGRLLTGYQRVATRLYDTAAATPGTFAFAGDLLLPGAIRIHELAGAARFVPSSGYLSGRFSGSVEMPRFDTRLTVANASFDTRGNFQLSAFGQAGFPGGAQTAEGRVLLRVPARRPLSIAVADNGSFAVSGGADLLFPGGHTISGYLSIDDPDYIFELAYGGAIRLALMKEVTLFRPVIDPAALPDLETLAAAGRVFGAIGTGFEAFFEDLDPALFPSPADLDPGAPPEFSNPVSTVPMDAWDAWLTTFANEEIIPLLNAPIDDSFDFLRTLLATIGEELTAARRDLAPDLQRLRQLRERLDRLSRNREVLDEMAERALIGAEDLASLRSELEQNAAAAIAFAEDYLTTLPAGTDLPHRLAAIDFVVESVANGQLNGLEVQVDTALLAAGLQAGAVELLAEAGLGPDGTVVNPAQLEATSFRRLMVLANVFSDFATTETLGNLPPGVPPVNYPARRDQFYDLAMARVMDQWLQADQNQDLENLAVSTVWLLEFHSLAELGYDVDPSAIQSIDDALAAMLAILQARFAGAGGQDVANKLAFDFLQAAAANVDVESRIIRRETREQLGRTPETQVDLDRVADRGNGPAGLLRLLAAHWRVLEDNGLLDPARLDLTRQGLRGWLQGSLSAFNQAALSAEGGAIDIAWVEANFQAAFNTLLAAADIIAFIEEYLPEESGLLANWTATWQALHIEWIGVAQARKAWWLLSEYTQNLAVAAVRFGDGVGAATAAAFHAAGGQALAGLQSVAGDFAALLAGVDAQAFLFPLPGDLVIDRLFGRLEFNRQSGFWKVNLGGAVRFPDANLFFSLDRGELASNGDFILALRTAGPAPFGLDDSLRLDIANAFSLSGNLIDFTLSSASASGTLIRQLSGGGQEVYTLSLGYAYLPPPPPSTARGEHRFNFSLGVGGDLEVFTEDLVVFRGGLGFELVIGPDGNSTQGAFEASAVVGILLKDGASAPFTPGDFELRLEGQASVQISGEESIVTLSGHLFLPQDFQAATCGAPGIPDPAAGRPVVSIPALQPLSFTYRSPEHPTPALRDTVAFAGALSLGNLRFSLPGLDLLWVDVCSLTLAFGFDSATGRPTAVLSDVAAIVNVPLPDGQTIRTAIRVGEWSLNRLPQDASIGLLGDLAFLNLGGFRLEALGADPFTGIPRSSIAIDPAESTFVITGTFRAVAENWFQDAAGIPVPVVNQWNDVSLTVNLPAAGFPSFADFSFDLGQVSLGCGPFFNHPPCELYLVGGMSVVNPVLTLVNPLRALRPTATNPFVIRLDLGVKFQTGIDYSITLTGQSMQLIFNGDPRGPLVDVDSLTGCIEADGNPISQEPLFQGLPLFVNEFCLTLKNVTGGEAIPLIPDDAAELPAFSIDNVEIKLSAGINFSVEGQPLIYGEFRDLVVGFVDGVPHPNVDGIGFGIDLTPFLGEELPFAGQVFIGGFQTGNYYFSGLLSANIKGNIVQAITAFDLSGPRGLCVGFAGAEAAIQLAYGFVLTGARGGLARSTGFVDPCAFITEMGINPITGRPAPTLGDLTDPPGPDSCTAALTSWEALLAIREGQTPEQREQFALSVAQAETVRCLIAEAGLDEADAVELVDGATPEDLAVLNEFVDENRLELAEFCPGPNTCPPASLGFLAQPHPESFIKDSPYEGRAIIKGTSLDETALNFFGINRDFVDAFVPDLGVDLDLIAARFAEHVRLGVEFVTPRPPADLAEIIAPLPVPDWALQFEAQLEENMNRLELGFYNAIVCALEGLGIPGTREELVDTLWDIVREAAYAGVPYEDVTLRLEGSFSYTGISTFASVTAGVLISTTGTSGLFGSINVFGIPFGTISAFTTQTDAYGRPSTGICGELVAAIGPFEIGRGGFIYDCPGCEARLFEVFFDLADALTGPYVYERMLEVAPEKALPGVPPIQNLILLATEDEKGAFLAAVLNTPPTLSSGQLTSAFRAFLIKLGNTLAPRLSYCAATQPKLFGFSLNGENALASSISYIGPKDPDNIDENATFLYGSRTAFSPFQMTAQTLLGATGGGSILGAFVPAIDQAALSTVWELPLPGTLLGELFDLSPEQFLHQQVHRFLTTSANTFDYSLSPLGMELGRASGRLLFPSYDHHPVGSNPRIPPADRGLPPPHEVLLAALGNSPNDPNLLGNPFWLGSSAEVAALFADNPDYDFTGQTASLVDDYFPHGGLLGAASFEIPLLLSQGLPESFFTVINPASVEVLEWLAAVGEFIIYLGSTERGGDLGFYLPAPNPPSLLGDGFPTSPLALLESLRTFDPLGELEEFYPFDRAFFRGRTDINLLGLPLASGSLVLVPAEGIFELEARIQAGSWLDAMFGTAGAQSQSPGSGQALLTASLDLGPAADVPVSDLVDDLIIELAALGSNPSPAEIQSFLDGLLFDFEQRLPRVGLEASLDFSVPEFLETFLWTEGAAEAVLFGFTPRFDPDYEPENDSPYAVARRQGGIGFRGSFTIGFEPLGLGLEVADASVAILGDTSPLGIPRFVANLEAPGGQLGYAGLAFEQVRVRFDTDPGPDGELVVFTGQSTPPQLGPLLHVEALDGSPLLGGSVAVVNSSPFPTATVRFDAARVLLPLLGNAEALIHGDGPNGEWSFSAAPGEAWSATLEIPGTLEFRNPLEVLAGNLQGEVLLTLDPTSPTGAFFAELEGVGLESFTLRVALATEGTLTLFPGQPTETSLTLGQGGAVCLLVDSSGRAYVDLGNRTLPLAGGLLAASGRVEFGFEPLDLTPGLAVSTAQLSFGATPLGNSQTAALTLSNTGIGSLTVDTTVSGPAGVFLVDTPRVVLGSFESREIEIRFLPATPGAAAGTLGLVGAGTGQPLASVQLTGSGVATPLIHLSDTAIDFGPVARGDSAEHRLVITNPGTGNMIVQSSFQPATSVFEVFPSVISVPAGQQRELQLTFRPTATGAASTVLQLNTNAGAQSVSLSGSGINRNWHQQRGGGETLRAAHFTSATAGWIVGDDGLLLRTDNGGALWRRQPGIDASQWRAVAFHVNGNHGLIAGHSGRLLTTANGGATWTEAAAGTVTDPDTHWQAGARAAEEILTLAGERGDRAFIAVRTAPQTWQTWASPTAPGLQGIAFASQDEKSGGIGIAVGPNRTVLRTTNGGLTWFHQDFRSFPTGFPDDVNLRAVASNRDPVNPVFLIAGDNGLILRSTNGGQFWEVFSLPAGNTPDLAAILFATNTNIAYAAGSDGVVWRTPGVAAGQPWAVDSHGSLGGGVHGMARFPVAGGAWAVGDSGSVYRRQVLSGAAPRIAGEDFSFTGLAPGEQGFGTYTVRNPGTAGATVNASLSSGPFEVTPAAADIPPGGAVNFHIVYNPDKENSLEGALLTFTSGSSNLGEFPILGQSSPARWVPLPAPNNQDLVGFQLVNPTTWVVATTQGVYRTTTSGQSWSQVASGAFTSMSFGSTGLGFVAGGEPGAGVVLRGQLSGTLWSPIGPASTFGRVVSI
ncbi:MAG: choice-of-anchor D domain-containing protein [Puniceicoccaceae bacterium]|nr:MAG: choice-of-anchor D domain-containing protein [Puniceicoccaceae bacterium]